MAGRSHRPRVHRLGARRRMPGPRPRARAAGAGIGAPGGPASGCSGVLLGVEVGRRAADDSVPDEYNVELMNLFFSALSLE